MQLAASLRPPPTSLDDAPAGLIAGLGVPLAPARSKRLGPLPAEGAARRVGVPWEGGAAGAKF